MNIKGKFERRINVCVLYMKFPRLVYMTAITHTLTL